MLKDLILFFSGDRAESWYLSTVRNFSGLIEIQHLFDRLTARWVVGVVEVIGYLVFTQGSYHFLRESL